MKMSTKTTLLIATALLCCPVAATGYNFFEAWPSDGGSAPPAVEDEPMPLAHFWFSTEIGFTIIDDDGAFRQVSDGDLLSDRHCIILTNAQLLRHFRVIGTSDENPGLDAVSKARCWVEPEEEGPIEDGAEPELLGTGDADPGGVDADCYRPTLFSVDESFWSDTLQRWISEGDLLSICGWVVRTNFQLIDAFEPNPIPVCGVGLDAVHTGPFLHPTDTGFLFSTEINFHSDALDLDIGHGDLLAEAGFIYRTNAELMAHFNPYSPLSPDDPADVDHDYGLDAAWVMWDGSVWFSTEECFYDSYWGWISDGDILCENGWVIRRNLALLESCGPLEDLANFGLDALHYFPWFWHADPGELAESDEP